MFAAYTGTLGATYDICVTSSPCAGVDTEESGLFATFVRTANDDFTMVAVAPTGGTSPWDVYVNGVDIYPGFTNTVSLLTGKRMTWGNAGDHSKGGPNVARSQTFYQSVLTSGQAAALYNNETTFTAIADDRICRSWRWPRCRERDQLLAWVNHL